MNFTTVKDNVTHDNAFGLICNNYRCARDLRRRVLRGGLDDYRSRVSIETVRLSHIGLEVTVNIQPCHHDIRAVSDIL